jgi:hypothetical protein
MWASALATARSWALKSPPKRSFAPSRGSYVLYINFGPAKRACKDGSWPKLLRK